MTIMQRVLSLTSVEFVHLHIERYCVLCLKFSVCIFNNDEILYKTVIQNLVLTFGAITLANR